jgi:DNA repair exonuclease SbcCD nuclease subunit
MSGGIRFIHTADLHLDASANIPSWRLIEQRDCLNHLREYAAEKKIGDIFIAGDVFEKHNPEDETVIFFLTWVGECVKAGIRIWAIPGNHDAKDHANQYNSMTPMVKTMEIVDAEATKGFNIIDKPRLLSHGPFAGYNIFFLPWMREAEYVAVLKALLPKHSTGINILVTHAFIKGSVIGDGGVKLSGGIPLKLFKKFTYVALGDIHLRQDFVLPLGMAHYCGSFFCVDFSERKEFKGFLDVWIDTGGNVFVDHIRNPHIIWTQRRIKLSVLQKVVVSKELFARKFPKKTFKGKKVKLVIDCEGGQSSQVPIDELAKRSLSLPVVEFTHELKNTGYSRPKRFKSRKTGAMMDELVDGDETVRGRKRKSRAKKVGKKLLGNK